MFKALKFSLFFVFIFSNLFNFYTYIRGEVFSTNMEALKQSVLVNYIAFDFRDSTYLENLDLESVVEKYDVVFFTKDTIYTNRNSVKGLYGSDKKCEIPFEYGDGSCDYVMILQNRPYYSFKKLDQFDKSVLTSEPYVKILVNKDEIESFSTYIDDYYLKLFNLDIPPGYSTYEYKYGYDYFNYKNSDKNDTNIILFLVLVLTFTSIIRRRNYINQMRINGLTVVDIFIKSEVKNILLDIFLVLFLYLISIFILQGYYSSVYLSTVYINSSITTILLLIVGIIIVEIIAYILMIMEDTKDYLKPGNSKKYFVLLVFGYMLLFVSILSQNTLNDLKSTYITERQNKVLDRMSVYSSYGISVYDLDSSKLSEEEITNIENIILNRMYLVDDPFTNTTYISDDYAEVLFNYDFNNKSSFLHRKCADSFESNLAVDTPSTADYKYSEYNPDLVSEMYQFNSDICYVIVADDTKYLNFLKTLFFNLHFYEDDEVDMEI